MKEKNIFHAVILTFLAGLSAYCQRPDLTFDHYNVEDGLSQSTVWNIFEDSKGFIWFCTPDGLNKFDGYSFHVYRHLRGDTNSIVSNHPFSLFEDSAQDLWIGHRGGLSKYSYRQERFTEVYRLPEITSEEEGMLPLHESDGKIWAWDRNRGIVGFNRQTLKEEALYPLPGKYLNSAKAYSRYGKTVEGKAFISSTVDMIIVFDFHTLTYQFLFNKLFDPDYRGLSATNKFAVDSKNNLWIPGQNGLVILDPKTLERKDFKIGFDGIYFTSCAFDSQGLLWAGSSTNGLYLIDPNTGSVINISKENYKENGLLYNYIESIFTDSAGNIWIGTNGFGIQKFSKHKNKFDHFDLKIGTNAFGGNLVKAIIDDDAGNLYAGTFGNGLYVISRTGQIRNYPVPQNNSVTGLAIGPAHELLLSNNVGLFTLRNNAIVPLAIQGAPSPQHITSLNGANGEVFVTSDIGVLSLANVAGQYRLKVLYDMKNTPLSISFYKDSKGRLWIGTQRSFYFASKRDSGLQAMEPITKNLVKSFYEDTHGNVWIATVGDLIRFQPETGEVEYLNEKNGFVNTFFYAALPGADGKIWVSSNQGLASYDPQTKAIKHFTVLDGLQSNEFNTGAFCRLKDGRLAFGGLNGLNVFDPLAIKGNPNLPKIAFTNFTVDDKPQKLDTSIVYKKQIILPYSQNTFSFEFSGLEYTSPENNRYAYMLKGHDKDWVQGGERRFVRYSRLIPGRYEFMVKASNSDGVWNEKPAIMVVIIEPPFYMESWFLAVMILAFVAIIVLISVRIVRQRYRARLRQLEVDHKIQLERGRISRDLHDHVGSQLTFIINQLDGDSRETMLKSQLTEARDAARTTMGNLRETIWALHSEAISLVDFTDRVKEFAIKQLRSKGQMQLDFSENLGPGHTFNPSRALNLFRIAQEVINNAIKHSHGSMLSINISYEGGRLNLIIADNGQGFHVKQTGQDSYGLQNIAFRAREINANLSISSVPEKGTSVVVALQLG